MLKRLFQGKSISEFETILSCARIVPGHIGAKIQRCRETSLINIHLSILSINLSLRLSPLRQWDIKQDGPAWVWCRKDDFCTRGPPHSDGMCCNGTQWPTHPPNSPCNQSFPRRQEYVPRVYFGGRSSREDCPDSWQRWEYKLKLALTRFYKCFPSLIQRGQPSSFSREKPHHL